MKGSKLLKHVRFKKKLRLVFHKSNKNIYLQLVDDVAEKTICSASTLDKNFIKEFADFDQKKNRINKLWAERLAASLAKDVLEKCKDRQIVFDVRNFRFGLLTEKIVDVLRDKGIAI